MVQTTRTAIPSMVRVKERGRSTASEHTLVVGNIARLPCL